MVETGNVLAAPETFARKVLPVYAAALARENFWEADIAAKVREAGALWARSGGEVDVLLDTVSAMASQLMDTALRDHHLDLQKRCQVLRRFGDACGRVAIELVWGFNQAAGRDSTAAAGPSTPRDLALSLLAGDLADAELSGRRIAPAYAVVAVRVRGATTAATESAFLRCAGPGALTLLRGERGYVLLPVRTEEDAMRVCTRVAGLLLPHDIWTAVACVDSSELPEARAAASDVLSLVTALRMPPGGYRRRDVLVEYAAVRSAETSRHFRRLIEPVMTTDVLRETLEALIAEDGNRTRAAERLIIHRSTIDYRLLRIEQLTGHSPSSVPGLRTLTAAYALYSFAEQDQSADVDLGLGLRLAKGA
jgi:hypothetical protein